MLQKLSLNMLCAIRRCLPSGTGTGTCAVGNTQGKSVGNESGTLSRITQVIKDQKLHDPKALGELHMTIASTQTDGKKWENAVRSALLDKKVTWELIIATCRAEDRVGKVDKVTDRLDYGNSKLLACPKYGQK